jgi:hypothetical protein
MSWKRRALVAAGALTLLAQAVPVTRDNPAERGASGVPADVEPLLRRACFDCHSNETRWPWYAWVAPVSWLLARDVHEGRRHLNFSTWQSGPAERRAKRQTDVGEEVSGGEMPPWFYVPLHAEAKLSAAERARLVEWAGAGGTGRRSKGD